MLTVARRWMTIIDARARVYFVLRINPIVIVSLKACAYSLLALDLKISKVMTSIESARTRAYSPDIGWRIVWQRSGMGLTFKEIATRLQIGVGTAHRIYTRFVNTGDVASLQRCSVVYQTNLAML